MLPFQPYQQDPSYEDVFLDTSESEAGSRYSDYLWMAPGPPPQGSRGVGMRRYSDPMGLSSGVMPGRGQPAGLTSAFSPWSSTGMVPGQGYPIDYQSQEEMLRPDVYVPPRRSLDNLRRPGFGTPLPGYSDVSLAPPDFFGRPGIVPMGRLGGTRREYAAGERERLLDLGVQFESRVDVAEDMPMTPRRRFGGFPFGRRPQYGREDSSEWQGRWTPECEERLEQRRGFFGRFSPSTPRRRRGRFFPGRSERVPGPGDSPTFRQRMQARMRRWSSGTSRGW